MTPDEHAAIHRRQREANLIRMAETLREILPRPRFDEHVRAYRAVKRADKEMNYIVSRLLTKSERQLVMKRKMK